VLGLNAAYANFTAFKELKQASQYKLQSGNMMHSHYTSESKKISIYTNKQYMEVYKLTNAYIQYANKN